MNKNKLIAMKYFSGFFTLAMLALSFSACEKAPKLPFYESGTAVTLSAGNTSIAPAPADSNNSVLLLDWTAPNYATDSSSVKYILQADVKGNGYAQPMEKVIYGDLSGGFMAKELNAFAVAHLWEFGQAYDMEARVISSYANNNDRYISNEIAFTYTPYKVPPKIALPTSGKLFLVGDATQGGWSNPVPTPAQEFSRIDETTFAGVFNLNGGKQYLVLTVNGDWSHKYSIADQGAAGVEADGDFGYDLPQNFIGPVTSGWYKITLDFQHGKYHVTPWSGHLPDNLFIVGDATPGGWSNPVPVPSQQFTRLNSSEFELTLNLTGGKQYLVLPVNGDWSHKYAVQDNSVDGLWAGGVLGYDFPQNFPGPAGDGTYLISVNFAKGDQGMFSVTKQ